MNIHLFEMGFLLVFIYFYFSGFPETIQFLVGTLSNRHPWILALAFLISTNRDSFQASNCKQSAFCKWMPSISCFKALRFSVILSAEEILSALPRFRGRKECYQIGWVIPSCWFYGYSILLFVNVFGWVNRNQRYYYFSEIWLQESVLPKSTWKRCKNAIKCTPFAINFETFPYSDYYKQSYGTTYVLQGHFSPLECLVVSN